jgi:hypothetical protein
MLLHACLSGKFELWQVLMLLSSSAGTITALVVILSS